VYIGINNYSGELVAINQFQIPNTENTTNAVNALKRRIKVLQRLQHVNIVQYLGTSVEGQTFNIFEEFVSGCCVTLASMLKIYQFDESLVKRYTTQILIGVTFLHERNIVHQLIKGANILVDGNGVIKLREFGTAGLISGIIGNSVITDDSFLWMAPEVLSGFTENKEADIWSIGCTVIEMVTRKPPWMDQYPNIVSAKQSIGETNGGPRIPDSLSQNGKDFLSLCFSINPFDRPTSRQLQQHPWLLPSSPLHRNSPSEPFQQYNQATHSFGDNNEVDAFQNRNLQI